MFLTQKIQFWSGKLEKNVFESLEGLSREAISFLNAQNDYFGPGGEYIADRIEQDFDLRWDYKRARIVII